jgi:hypothetical protein
MPLVSKCCHLFFLFLWLHKKSPEKLLCGIALVYPYVCMHGTCVLMYIFIYLYVYNAIVLLVFLVVDGTRMLSLRNWNISQLCCAIASVIDSFDF